MDAVIACGILNIASPGGENQSRAKKRGGSVDLTLLQVAVRSSVGFVSEDNRLKRTNTPLSTCPIFVTRCKAGCGRSEAQKQRDRRSDPTKAAHDREKARVRNSSMDPASKKIKLAAQRARQAKVNENNGRAKAHGGVTRYNAWLRVYTDNMRESGTVTDDIKQAIDSLVREIYVVVRGVLT